MTLQIDYTTNLPSKLAQHRNGASCFEHLESRFGVRNTDGRYFVGNKVMAIQDRVKEAIDKLSMNDPINALIQICIAIDATGKKEYPKEDTSVRCKNFLAENRGFISRVSFGKLVIRGPILFPFKLQNGTTKHKTLEEVLYHLVRCSLVHEGDLPNEVEITPKPQIGMTVDGKVLIPIKMLWALILAVIGSPDNKSQRLPPGYKASIDDVTVDLNEFWGQRERIYNLVKKHNV